MVTAEGPKQEKPVEKTTQPATAAPDVEAQTTATTVSGTPGVSSILSRWKREDLLKKGSLVLRGVALVFSLLSFIIMASNQHGDWKQFDKYEEFRYLLAIAILATLYLAAQVLRQFHHISTGKELLSMRTSNLVDFFGDQITVYLLISSASAAVPMTNRMRNNIDNMFTDSLAASISMAFFAFLVLSISAMVSGFKLSNQTYI